MIDTVINRKQWNSETKIFLKNVFIFKDRTLKKNNIERTRISMWFGRENDENVVRTRH